MCDFLTREFRAQLTLNMEATLKKAVCDIMKIFENSLHAHQLELVQKGEEVAHLKVKLQTAELKLRDWECKLNQGAEKSGTQLSETQREPRVVMNPSGQTTDVPEIDFEVPDDWCAPMADETTTTTTTTPSKPTTKQDDIVCPSIRLRPLLIPLHRIPIIKQEMISHDIDQQTKGVRRSTRCSTLNEGEHTQNKRGPGRRGKSAKGVIKKILLDTREESPGQTSSIGLRLRENHGLKEQNNAVKRRKGNRKAPASMSTEKTVKNNGKKYSCKFCDKVFDTEFGQIIHSKSHRRCQGCKKVFPFPSSLAYHKQNCKKLKRWLAKKALGTKPTPQSREQVILKEESSLPSDHPSELSVQKVGPTKKHPCVFCKKKFYRKSKLREHMRVHTGETPYRCTICQKKFTTNSSLKTHLKKIHHVNPSELHRDLAWTIPLEDTEAPEHLILPDKDAQSAVSLNSVQREQSPRIRSDWQTMGERSADGYICSVCKKLLTTRFILVEHYRIHTGEKPLKCHVCPAMFRTLQQRYMHQKRHHSVMGLSQCEKCMKLFTSKIRFNKHVSKCTIEKRSPARSVEKASTLKVTS